MKIIHTADIHLGNSLRPELARRAFAAILDRTVAERADLLIIAGDLFDSNRAARSHLDFVLAELSQLPVPVVLLPGNHDAYDSTSPYREVAISEHHPGVNLISGAGGRIVRFPQLSLTIWGEPVVEHSPGFFPIGSIPERDGSDWHVAVAHGLYVADGEETDLSSPILERQLVRAGWDYFALGHVHSYREISCSGVLACYPGSPVRAVDWETGTGTVALVELDTCSGIRVCRLRVAH